MVTGPSLTSSTCMSVRNTPVLHTTPLSRTRATHLSYSGSASSGRAAENRSQNRKKPYKNGSGDYEIPFHSCTSSI